MSLTPTTRADENGARAKRLQRLRRMLEDYQRRRPGSERGVFVPTGLPPLDEALPHGGLPLGAVTEIISPFEGSGAMNLAIRIARAAADGARTVAVVDSLGDFYPPAAWQAGIAADRLLVIRTTQIDRALWAVDQILRCPAVAAVVAPICRLDRAASRRLQLAAESTRAVALLLRPTGDRNHSFAAVQMLVEPLKKGTGSEPNHPGVGKTTAPRGACPLFQRGKKGTGSEPNRLDTGETTAPRGACPPFQRHHDSHYICESPFARLCRVTLLKVREGMPAEPFLIELGDETGYEPLLPLPGHRPAELARRRISA